MALLRRRRAAGYTAERPVVVERRRGPGIMTVLTSAIGWVVLLVVLAIVLLVVLL